MDFDLDNLAEFKSWIHVHDHKDENHDGYWHKLKSWLKNDECNHEQETKDATIAQRIKWKNSMASN